VKNAAGCLKIQAEIEAANGATCRIAEIWQRFVASVRVCEAAIRLGDDDDIYVYNRTLASRSAIFLTFLSSVFCSPKNVAIWIIWL
jgi:hypothetical protein